jgi:CubicO group peptidase (beta-lactamase class C family)
VGVADAAAGREPDADTQFRIGSITKTFTATLVMQCRDDGLLSLDDQLGGFVPDSRHGELTIRRMLSHLSGLQREPVGDIWEKAAGPTLDELISGLELAEAVLPPGRRWHYSNLAFALLGEVVARLRGSSWEDVLQGRILDPLGLRRTTTRRSAPFAVGYFTDPYADRLLEEPEFPGNAFAPAGELWSTPADLGRWASFLAAPDASVLAADTVEEMCHPQVMHDLDGWTLGWGLGLMLYRRGDRVLVGHGGAMPGFLAGIAVRRKEQVGAVAFANTSAGADPEGLAIDLALTVVDRDPAEPDAWRPGPDVPAAVEELVGVWWSEGSQFVFSARQGRLEARAADLPPGKEPASFELVERDLFRAVAGREHGELLRVVRRPDGSVDKLYWATYPFTRDPRTFGT